MTPAFSGRATTVFSRPPTARTGLSITPRRPRNILIADAPHACSRSPGMPMARPISAGRCRCRQFWMSRRTRWKRIRRLANKPGAGKQFELVSGRPVASSPANCGTVRQPASVPKYHLHGRFDFGRPSRNLLPQPSQIKIMIHKTNLPLRAAMLCAALLLNAGSVNLRAETFRPPSVPLVACDPYFSLWSPADKLTDADTTHWTGKARQLTGLVKIDGKNFRVMGAEPTDVPVLPQTSLEVLPTRTIYSFEGEGVRLTLTFMTAALPDDLDLLSRPVTYLTWKSTPTEPIFMPDAEPSRKERGHRGVRPCHPSWKAFGLDGAGSSSGPGPRRFRSAPRRASREGGKVRRVAQERPVAGGGRRCRSVRALSNARPIVSVWLTSVEMRPASELGSCATPNWQTCSSPSPLAMSS